ncbi:unnamed protein product, partial [Mesorhabditis spiculigera]
MEDNGSWCLIESDPAVFSELIRNFGVTGVQVEEIYSMDDEACAPLQPIHGLIFLYKWRAGDEPMGTPATDPKIYFAQQVITNACATQAIINLLLNLEHPDIGLGDTLSEFKSFSKDFDPACRGLVLGNSEQIRSVHNSFARAQLYEVLQPAGKDEDAFHFITYVPIGDKVYELDGLRECPLEVGTVQEGQDWMDVVRPVINARIAKYQQGEITFNLLALVKDLRAKLQEELEALGETGDPSEVARLIDELQQENKRQARWILENRRRRHNYIPFIVDLLRTLAREDKLVPLVKSAIAKKKAATQMKKERAEAKASVKTEPEESQ